MKKLLFALAIFVGLSLSSCDPNEGEMAFSFSVSSETLRLTDTDEEGVTTVNKFERM